MSHANSIYFNIGSQYNVRIYRNWMPRAIISINVIRVQAVFQTCVWFFHKCSRQVPGSAGSILVLFLAFQVRRVCLGFSPEY